MLTRFVTACRRRIDGKIWYITRLSLSSGTMLAVCLLCSVIIISSKVERFEQVRAGGQWLVLEVAERVGHADVVADANVPAEDYLGAVPESLNLVAVWEGALDKNHLADILRMAVLELDFVSALLVGYAVDGALNFLSAEALALQPHLGTCSPSTKYH